MTCLGAAILCGAVLVPPQAEAQTPPAQPLKTRIVYLSKNYPEPPPLSLLEKILTDEGTQGARQGFKDISITGRLIGHAYEPTEAVLEENEDVGEKAKALLAEGHRFIVADLEAADLLTLSELAQGTDAIIVDSRTRDDELRQEQCRANVFHVSPNWAMRADALAQYLLWKGWRRWFVIHGKSPDDAKYVTAIKRAATRFGARIVEERAYQFEAGARRVETGHQQIQTQMPMLTQRAAEHDVIYVSDVGEAFGDYLLFRTTEPKLVVGTQGLVATAWHRSYEQYGGMALQNSFEKAAKRIMTERDYTAWLAIRIFGEAVTRLSANSPDEVRRYILSDKFEIAGFKGQGMTFRPWDNQLRQPVLLAGPRALVSVSPQEGFLHPKFFTDTLGFDEPESKCRFPR